MPLVHRLELPEAGLFLLSAHPPKQAGEVLRSLDQVITDFDGTSEIHGAKSFRQKVLEEIIEGKKLGIETVVLTARSEMEVQSVLDTAYDYDRDVSLRFGIENGAFLVEQDDLGRCDVSPLMYDPIVARVIVGLRFCVFDWFKEINKEHGVYLFLGGAGTEAVEGGLGYGDNVKFAASLEKGHKTIMYIEIIRQECLRDALKTNKRSSMRMLSFQSVEIIEHIRRCVSMVDTDNVLRVTDLGNGSVEVSAPDRINKGLAVEKLQLSNGRVLFKGDAGNDLDAMLRRLRDPRFFAAAVLHSGNTPLHGELGENADFGVLKAGGAYLLMRAIRTLKNNGNDVSFRLGSWDSELRWRSRPCDTVLVPSRRLIV